jgi:hypothetical protein
VVARLALKSLQYRKPTSFRVKAEVVFLPILIGIVHAQAPFVNKKYVVRSHRGAAVCCVWEFFCVATVQALVPVLQVFFGMDDQPAEASALMMYLRFCQYLKCSCSICP